MTQSATIMAGVAGRCAHARLLTGHHRRSCHCLQAASLAYLLMAVVSIITSSCFTGTTSEARRSQAQRHTRSRGPTWRLHGRTRIDVSCSWVCATYNESVLGLIMAVLCGCLGLRRVWGLSLLLSAACLLGMHFIGSVCCPSQMQVHTVV